MWISQIIRRIRNGSEPPTSPPENLFANPRLTERYRDGPHAGTILDSRAKIESALKYKDFEEASRNERAPVRFVGLAEDVTRLTRPQSLLASQCRSDGGARGFVFTAY